MATPEEEKGYREDLYLLMEKIRATRAAFYLVDPGGGYRLQSSYGFGRGDKLAERLQRADPLPTTIFEKREPFFVNDVRSAGKLAETMEATSSTRLLAAPLYLDGRIVGILDVRDKAGREVFGNDDIPWVKDVLRRIAAKVRSLPYFASPPQSEELAAGRSPFEQTATFARRPPVPGGGLQLFESSRVSDAPAGAPPASAAGGGVAVPPPAPAVVPSPLSHLPNQTARVARQVEEALASAAALRPAAPAAPAAARDASFSKLFLETCLHLPDVVASALTVVEPAAATLTVASRRPVTDEAMAALIENVEKIFFRSGARFELPGARNVVPLDLAGGAGTPVQKGEVAAIQSSALTVGPEEVTVFSLVFRHGPGAENRDTLRNVHLLCKSSIVEVRAAGRYREAFRALVNKLLEPSVKRYTSLKTHSFNVGRMARRFATSLGMAPSEVEQLTVAGILHDVGMRDLNYDELYTKRTLSDEEFQLIREHPRVGAYLVEDVPWPYPVAPLIRHHHERWDGAGYPDGLRAEMIPVGARMIHLCEAFDAMTSPSSYRSVLSAGQALEIIVSKRGTQFDPELAVAFRKMVEAARTQPGGGR